MSFLNPILAGLGIAFVAMPIILHFLRRRRPPVLWGAMRFLAEAYKRKRRRMTLEQLLLLASRCLLVIVIALLIGRPSFGVAAWSEGPREVHLLLDNSIASARRTPDGIALDALKRQAIAMLDGLDAAAGDRASLVLLAGPAEGVVFPPSGDLSSIRRLVQAVEPRDSAADLPGAFSLLAGNAAGAQADGTTAARSVVVLSELRAGSAKQQRALPVLSASLGRLIAPEPSAQVASNVSVTGVRPLRRVLLGEGRIAGQASVSLERSGGEAAGPLDVPVTLAAGRDERTGLRVGSGSVRFEPGQTEATGLVSFDLPAASESDSPVLTARVVGDDLERDNAASAPLERRRDIEVGVIARRSLVGRAGLDRFAPADWIRLALAPSGEGGRIRVIDVSPAGVDAPRLSTLDAVIVVEPDAITPGAWTDLRRFADAGGLVVVTPGTEAGVQLWTDQFLETMSLGWTIDRSTTEPESAGIDPDSVAAGDGLLGMLSGEIGALSDGLAVSRVLAPDIGGGSGSIELASTTGDPLIVSARPGSAGNASSSLGLVVYFASSPTPSWTDLPARPLMVPMMQELVRQGLGVARGSRTMLAGRGTDLAEDTELVDAEGLPAAVPLRDAGVLRVLDDRGGERSTVAVNPDTSGSGLDPGDRARLEAWFAAATGDPRRVGWLDESGEITLAEGSGRLGGDGSDSGVLLWLASAALALAVFETLLARFASRGAEAARLAQGVTA